jgi:hypothetical protein
VAVKLDVHERTYVRIEAGRLAPLYVSASSLTVGDTLVTVQCRGSAWSSASESRSAAPMSGLDTGWKIIKEEA